MNARTGFLSIMLTAVAACFAHAALPEAINATAPNVVYITVNSGGAMSSAGSGCYIGERVVLTCRHLFDGERTSRAKVTFPDGDVIASTLVAADNPFDTVLLLLDESPKAKGCKLAARNAAIGDRTWLAGYSHKELLYVGGTVQQFVAPRGGASPDWVKMTGAANSGDSGGPVFNEQGEVIGNLWGSETPQGADGMTTFSNAGRTHKLLNDWWQRAAGKHAQEVGVLRFLRGGSGLGFARCGPQGCQPGYGGGGGGGPGGRERPTEPQISGTPTMPPGYQDGGGNIPAPIIDPPTKEPAADKLAELHKKLDDLTEKIGAIKPVPGPPGPKGDKGDPGKDATCDHDQIVADVLAKIDYRKIAGMVQVQPPAAPSAAKHLVLVADPKASYWARLESEYKRASEVYHGITHAPTPNFDAGPMPQLVVYEGGDPVHVYKGSYDVSTALAQVYRGDFK
jgi:hypothetical protein